MQIAMSNALALMRWHGVRFLQDFSSRDFVWMLIGALLAVGAIWVLSRRRRRWF
jgi:LPXTG-motif cell wall-anchored protein